LTKSYTTVVGLAPGSTYAFKVYIRNSVGYSIATEISVLAAQKPDMPATPTTSITGGTNVLVSWMEPYDGASPIISYSITFRHADEVSYSVELSNCDGSDSQILSDS
jgi:hypothetical protein